MTVRPEQQYESADELREQLLRAGRGGWHREAFDVVMIATRAIDALDRLMKKRAASVDPMRALLADAYSEGVWAVGYHPRNADYTEAANAYAASIDLDALLIRAADNAIVPPVADAPGCFTHLSDADVRQVPVEFVREVPDGMGMCEWRVIGEHNMGGETVWPRGNVWPRGKVWQFPPSGFIAALPHVHLIRKVGP